MNWDHRSVRTADGTELAVWSCGPSEGVPVLLVHGFSLDHTTWCRVAEFLLDRGFHVVAPDLRGHGESALGSTKPTLDLLVADLADILFAFELPDAHLVGHSLGAVIVLGARVNPRLSGTVSSVTSIAGTEQAVQNPVMKAGARLFSSAAGIWLLRRRRMGRMIISTWFGKNPDIADLDWIRELSASCEPATRAAIASATSGVDLRPTFPTTGPPTLVVCGQRDRATSPRVSARIAGAIDGAELHLVEDGGHMVMIEKPNVVTELLTNWLSRLP